MLFLEESESEEQLLASLQQAERFSPGTELLQDVRIQLEEYYLRYKHWTQAGTMLLQDLAASLEEALVLNRIGDVVKRLLRLGENSRETMLEAAQRLGKTSEGQETGQIKAQFKVWEGHMYEKIRQLERAEESFLAAWKLSLWSGRKELIVFYMRNRLFNEVEELLYQDYLKSNTKQALKDLEWFYREMISILPAKYEDLSSKQNNSLTHFQRFLSLPRLPLTHSPSFPMSKSHLSLLNVRIHSFAVYLSRARRLTRCIPILVKFMQLMLSAGSLLGLELAEVIRTYAIKSSNNEVLYQEDMHIVMLGFLVQCRGNGQSRNSVLGFLAKIASKVRNFEEMERMTVRRVCHNPVFRWQLGRAYSS